MDGVALKPSAADARFLAEAVALAERGRFRVEPNPLVGAVVVRRGRVVGRGWHRAYGGPHAEVEALRAAGPRARGATVYVSLEPCTTVGKTPPCAVALARAGVARVVWAARDPDPRHGGRARAALRAAGIVADGPVAVPGAAALLAPFRRGLAAGRPWVLWKWASSLDGRVSPAAGRGGTLSGPASLALLHELRGRVEAVAVGVGTVEVDDPRLTCRRRGGPPHGRPQPAAVVFDTRARTPRTARLLTAPVPGRRVLVLVADARTVRARALARVPGVEVIGVGARGGHLRLDAALAALAARGVHRLLLEGGPRVAAAALAAGLVDQVAALLTPRLLGADGAPTALAGTPFTSLPRAPRLASVRVRRVGEDVLVEGYPVIPAPHGAVARPRPGRAGRRSDAGGPAARTPTPRR